MGKWTVVMVAAFVALFMLAVAGAGAAPDCAAVPAPGVDWSGCDKSAASGIGDALKNADLSSMILVGTNFTGTDLKNAELSDTQIEGADFSGADVKNATFSGALGTPIVSATGDWSNTTCPNGTAAAATEPYCSWEPLAVTLVGAGGSVVTAGWPAALFGLLLAGSAGLWLLRRTAVG